MKYPYDEAEKLAQKIRPLISFSGPMLFHGTRTPCTIAMQDVLRCPDDSAVCFTRLLHIAGYWAALPRRGEDEQYGAVLVLDRTKLAQRYRLECYRDPCCDNFPERAARKSSEAEECIVGRDVTNLRRYIVDVIWTDGISVIEQPELNHDFLRPMPVSKALIAWSYGRLTKKTPRSQGSRTSPFDHHKSRLLSTSP
jgi:hypothetical protein